MRTLFEAGKGAGKLEAEEIALALDELDLDPAQLDEFYTALEEAQVDVVGSEQSEAEAEKEWASEAEISTDTLQLFLKDIGKVPLLTAAQEVELAKRIELGWIEIELVERESDLLGVELAGPFARLEKRSHLEQIEDARGCWGLRGAG